MGDCVWAARLVPSLIVRLGSESVIAIVILAAGASRRMGTPKQILPLSGRPLVWWTASQACASEAHQVVVVTGCKAAEVEAAVAGLPVTVTYNPDWQEGQAGSVKAGLNAVRRECRAVMFLPADQPLITPEFLNSLMESYRRRGAGIVAPEYRGMRGTPVLFDLKWRSAILGLDGDQGARKLLEQFPEEVEYVTVTEKLLLLDADTPDEYQALQELWAGREKAYGQKKDEKTTNA